MATKMSSAKFKTGDKLNQQTKLASIGGINYVAGKTKLWQIPQTPKHTQKLVTRPIFEL